MMVLRHIGPPCTIVSHEDEEDGAVPIDLSKKHVPIEVPHRHSNNKYISIVPSIRSAHHHAHSRNIVRNSERNLNSRICRAGPNGASVSEVRWREINYVHGNDEDNSYSSPDSGLQRDSPGEDDEQAHNSATPPLQSRRQDLINLSLIRGRYNQNERSESSNNEQDEEPIRTNPPDQVRTKRARLEEMVSHIKQGNPSQIGSQRLSGDDDTSSGGHASSDEIADEIPTDLRHEKSSVSKEQLLAVPNELYRLCRNDNEPFNLTYPKVRPNSPQETIPLEFWKDKNQLKNMQGLSPAEAAKAFGIDPETYQQQMMQLQLTSAAMIGDPGGFLKAMGNCPPWVYLSYYQLMQNFQAQELIRQYAMQSQSAATPTTIPQGDKSPNIPVLGSSSYNCRSPMSPASLSEGPNGMDSDGSIVGQSTSGNANGKRAPRAMTGRHVRTGTGASPSTLQTLREKIEERQRLKAQQSQGGTVLSSHSKGKGVSNTNINNNNSSVLNNNHCNISQNKASKKSKK